MTATSGSTTPEATEGTGRRVLQRLVLPADKDVDVLALYVDPDAVVLDADKYTIGGNRGAKDLNTAQIRQSVASGDTIHPDQITGRHSVRLEAGEDLSFGTYFNAFPAGYWRRWTVVADVRLTVNLTGAGSTVTVYRSMANGRSQRVDTGGTGADAKGEFTFELPLKPFVDGGWYWYDVVAGEEAVNVEAVWDAEVPADRVDPGSVTIAITTMNRPDYCGKLLAQLGGDAGVQALLDEVLVMEQGTLKVVESPEFPGAEQALGDKLRVIEQGNIGGSGGYARGQAEAVRKNTATYLMCMDDDVVCEPESIIRAVTFGDLAKRPTIVGGHMFSIYDRSRLHSFGEVVQPWKFWWGSPKTVYTEWDFSARNLRSARWLHRRIDVDFNGWFMCMIPLQTLKEIGLSLPLFIKWDDSEFGLRAKAAGYPTVTFPGAAVWHIPWSDKNDALDWQAYFHHRNR
ncbi:MAG: glycosyltransferase, partial [Marmoricola sp.]